MEYEPKFNPYQANVEYKVSS